MHTNTILVIVGNRFDAFANDNNCSTLDGFLRQERAALAPLTRLILGQGLDTAALGRIRARLRELELDQAIEVEEVVSQKAQAAAVHKRCQTNVMITRATETGLRSFGAHLVIDEACAELSDHVTGLHIQGTLFIEAARQAFMLCAPTAIRAAGFDEHAGFDLDNSGYTLREIQVSYKKFLYPLPVQITISLSEIRNLKRLGLLATEACVRFEQLGEVGVEVRFNATRSDKSALLRLETVGAQDLTARWLSSLPQLPAVARAGAEQYRAA
ncbi:MAG: AfsA-related hotdog domain-containing protein [Pseudomonadota bacterium]